jgi:hypothetical protein
LSGLYTGTNVRPAGMSNMNVRVKAALRRRILQFLIAIFLIIIYEPTVKTF